MTRIRGQLCRERVVSPESTLALLFFIIVVFGSSVFLALHSCLQYGKIPHVQRAPPIILAWTGFFGEHSYKTPDLFQLECPVWNCHLTSNRSQLLYADAVVFHVRDVDLRELPERKPRGQRWIMVNYEAPGDVPGDVVQVLESQVDLTVSYRQDSDVVSPYGLVGPRKDSDPPPMDLSETDFRRKLPVAWMVNNCATSSDREELARKLMTHIRVDLYGKCAESYEKLPGLSAPVPGISRMTAYSYLTQRYKFYLSFEDSLCTDYTTEIAFYPLLVGMVPVVYGAADYRRILPPRSFVDSSAFDTPQSLAKHLDYLSKNYTAYMKYHEWRKRYAVQYVEVQNTFFCELCARLHENPGRFLKSGRNLSSWWDTTNQCRSD